MVFYTASEKHFSSTLHCMNDLRKESSFCDIVLKVGSYEKVAHRCVLAAGSSYFRSLFLGQFTESTMKEINLTEVTDDTQAMEMILNFMYSGEIEINAENLGIMIKLSSFFLLETLREFCADFMKETLSLRNCLTYYIYAASHGLMTLETSTGFMIKSRFHDCLIFDENTLNITPEQLMFLIDKGILKHCSASSLLQFLTKWVTKGQTGRHIEVGLELLEALERKECGHGQVFSELTKIIQDTLFERLSTVLEEKDVEDQQVFLVKLKSNMKTLVFGKTLAESKLKSNAHYKERLPGPSTAAVPGQNSLDSSEEESSEMAIITLSPKKCVVDEYLKQRDNLKSVIHYEPEPFGQPVYDVCAYIPSTQSWHYMCQFEEDDTPEYLLDTSGYECRFFVLGNHVAFVDNRGENIDMYNLKTDLWHAPAVNYSDTNFDIDHMANDVCFVMGQNDEKYLVVRMRIFTDQSFDQATEMYFKGYKLGEDGETWNGIFVTSSRIRTNLSDNGGMPEMNARISKSSNEMIVTHSTLDGGWNIVFVVNLNDISPAPVTLMSEFIEDKDIFRGLAILEEKDKFLLVSNGTKNCGGMLQVMYEYHFNSKELIELRRHGMVISTVKKPFEQDDEEAEYPCLCEVSATDGKSIWYLEGNMDTVSALSEISIDQDTNKFVIKEHPPPPFACFTRAYVGQVNKKLLKNRKHIKRFLFKEKRKLTSCDHS